MIRGIEGLKSDHWRGSAAHLDRLCPHWEANFEFNQLELLKTIFWSRSETLVCQDLVGSFFVGQTCLESC